MKTIISGERPYLKVAAVLHVSVLNFDELSPKNVIEALDLENDKKFYSQLLRYCPEL